MTDTKIKNDTDTNGTSLPPLSAPQALPTRGTEASATPPATASRDTAGHPPALRTQSGGDGGAVAIPSDSNATAPHTPPAKSKAKKLIPMGIAAALAAGLAFQAHEWWTVGRFQVSTDDAYVKADVTTLAAKVSGYVTAVGVVDNQSVKAGDILATIDDGDLRLAVQAAADRLATQDATLDRLALETEAADASIAEAQARIDASEAAVDRAEREFDRQSRLVKSGVAKGSALDDARADRDEALANREAAKAQLTAARADKAVLQAKSREAQGQRAELATALNQAERDLSFATIRAPVNGVIGNKAVEVGQYVQPGQRLAALVPLSTVHVDANFKETQLEDLRPGQPVEIAIDAYPDTTFPGHVESLSPASGAEFSLLPPENATGNFTKIVQRLPVRVAFDGLTDLPQPRPGMSVVVTVTTKDGLVEGQGATAAAAETNVNGGDQLAASAN